MEKETFIERLLNWYKVHKRSLPWRKNKDPYRRWLSEIILQQTRVVQGIPYYEKFVNTYPKVEDLALASEEEVLHLWQGLGYYSRARNLHKCSRYIVEKLEGRFPSSYKPLLALPGIGTYTAAAVASIVFNQSVPLLDGNVYRLLSRLFGLEDDITSSAGKKAFHKLAEKLLPIDEAGRYNEALMEFGALQCTPKQPLCITCPFQKECIAFRTKRQSFFPVKKRRVKVRNRYFYYFLIHDEEKVYLRQRREKDIWQGLYDFYLIEHSEKIQNSYDLDDPLLSSLKRHRIALSGEVSFCHQLTHQRLHLNFSHIYATPSLLKDLHPILKMTKMIPYSYQDIYNLPFPRAVHLFLNKA